LSDLCWADGVPDDLVDLVEADPSKRFGASVVGQFELGWVTGPTLPEELHSGLLTATKQVPLKPGKITDEADN